MAHTIDHENDGNMGENAGESAVPVDHTSICLVSPAAGSLCASSVGGSLLPLHPNSYSALQSQLACPIFKPSLPLAQAGPLPMLLPTCPPAPADRGLLHAPLQSTREVALGRDLGMALRSRWLVPPSRWPFAILSLSTDSPGGLWALTQVTETITFSNCSVEPSCSACIIPSTY